MCTSEVKMSKKIEFTDVFSDEIENRLSKEQINKIARSIKRYNKRK